MRFHLRFLRADPDLCKWRHSVESRMLSFYINSILYAEIHKKIAYIPQSVLLSMDAAPCDIHLRINSPEVEAYILAIPQKQRNTAVKEVIRKHLRAQTGIRAVTQNPFAKNIQMTPPGDYDAPAVTVSVRPAPAKKEKKPAPQIAANEKPVKKQEATVLPEKEGETDEEREMRMALIAMAGE